ncbi:hypothetical protein D6783_05890 [Candidatus Woesearchaeota archaeon]|nr:MAG: hypothetical protein D6783_05890 [Candidatus Woesearchaeota archaeon]
MKYTHSSILFGIRKPILHHQLTSTPINPSRGEQERGVHSTILTTLHHGSDYDDCLATVINKSLQPLLTTKNPRAFAHHNHPNHFAALHRLQRNKFIKATAVFLPSALL